MSSASDIRHFIDRIQESQDLNEINWRQSLAAATAAGMMAGTAGAMPLNTQTNIDSSSPTATKIIGGWYPVFFDRYSVEKIDEIVERYRDGKIKQIRVIYDENSELANKISKNLSVLTGTTIKPIHQPNTDTPETQYDHHRVVVEIN